MIIIENLQTKKIFLIVIKIIEEHNHQVFIELNLVKKQKLIKDLEKFEVEHQANYFFVHFRSIIETLIVIILVFLVKNFIIHNQNFWLDVLFLAIIVNEINSKI